MRIATVIALFAACQTNDVVETPRAPSYDDVVRAALQRMHQRTRSGDELLLAIALGNLDAAHVHARVLENLDEPALVGEHRRSMDELRDSAHHVVVAGNLGTAAEQAADVALACAHCHVSMHARVVVADAAKPATGMVAHQVAATRMWHGFVAGDEESWAAGAAELASMPSNLVGRAATPAFPDDLDDVARIRLYATRAATPMSLEHRAALFGQILATCAHCHDALRDR